MKKSCVDGGTKMVMTLSKKRNISQHRPVDARVDSVKESNSLISRSANHIFLTFVRYYYNLWAIRVELAIKPV